jgi:hypothetical protein
VKSGALESFWNMAGQVLRCPRPSEFVWCRLARSQRAWLGVLLAIVPGTLGGSLVWLLASRGEGLLAGIIYAVVGLPWLAFVGLLVVSPHEVHRLTAWLNRSPRDDELPKNPYQGWPG